MLFFWQGHSTVNGQVREASFNFKHILDKQGTLSNYNNCFLKDKDGFLWIGTGNGLKRFDGNEFTVFRHVQNDTNSLIHSDVFSLCEDKEERIWIGTGEGICYYDKKTNRFQFISELNKANFVCLNIVCDNNGNIWFSIRDQGLFYFNTTTKRLHNFKNNPSDNSTISHNRILNRGLALDPLNKGIWLVTKNGLNFFNFEKSIFVNKKNNPENNPIFNFKDVSTINVDQKKLVFYDAFIHKIIYYDVLTRTIEKEIIFEENKGKEDSDISCIFIDSKHNLWLSAWNHCSFFYDVESQKTYSLKHNNLKPNSISANLFWDGFQEKDGSIWLATSNGISITNPAKNFFEIFDISELYPELKGESELRLFQEDNSDKTWWLSTAHADILHYNPAKNALKTYIIPQSFEPTKPSIIGLIDYKESIFSVSTNAIYRFDKKNKKLTYIAYPDDVKNKHLISNSILKGDNIWVYGEYNKAFSYSLITQKWTSYPIKIESPSPVSSSETDSDGNIWLGIHARGLAKFSKQKQSFEMAKTSSTKDFRQIGYTGIKKDKNGDFWIGTYDLIKFNPTSGAFNTALDLNTIHSLMVDNRGRIWTSAFNDFTIFNPETNNVISKNIEIDKGNLKWKNYLFYLRNGKVLSLMKSIITVIDPLKISEKPTTEKVLICKIFFNNNEVLFHKDSSEINLKNNDNVFEIFFSTLNISQKYKYKYQIIGINDDWILTTNNSASFSNLKQGNYVFKVMSIDESGHESPSSLLNIHIETVFYKTSWFLYSCILLFCFLVYSFLRFLANERSKIYSLRMQSARLEKDKSEIQYQNLINHLNPHFLFNSLTSLNSLIMTEPKQASNFLQKLSLIYRYILQNKEKDLVTLEQELNFVKHYIDLQKSRFEESLKINISIDKAYFGHSIVPVTLQNLFENAIKHNIIEEENPLYISLSVESDYLIFKNNLQKKEFVETSNKQGLQSLQNLYDYFSPRPIVLIETASEYIVKIPLL